MQSGRELTEVKIVLPTDNSLFINVEDGFGLVMCQVNYDDQPDEVAHKVARAICAYAGIKFTPLEGYE